MGMNEALAIRVQQGDKEALPLLWDQVKGFAIQQACRYTPNPRVSREDLIQCAYIGMHRAALQYDANRGSGFLNFMQFGVRRECSDALNLRGKPKIEADYSLDAPVKSMDGETPMHTIIPDTHAPDAADQLMQAQLTQALHDALDRLPEDKAQVLHDCFFSRKSMVLIGAERGVSRQRAHQLTMRALDTLRADKQLLRFLRESGFDVDRILKGQTKGKRYF